MAVFLAWTRSLSRFSAPSFRRCHFNANRLAWVRRSVYRFDSGLKTWKENLSDRITQPYLLLRERAGRSRANNRWVRVDLPNLRLAIKQTIIDSP